MSNQTLLVNKTDFADIVLYSDDITPLQDDHIRVDVGPFALTANNITYMVVGNMMYWNFFDPAKYGIDQKDTGRMPVWGYATVTDSKVDGIDVGEVIYGFFPVIKSFDIKPIKISSYGFHDGADHRLKLHAIYNNYTRIKSDPGFDGKADDIQPILRPLFTTSFLIDDQFADEGFYGADQVLILSASSKTALGTAFCMKQRGDVKITGLTSAKNKTFVESTGFYDHVVGYDEIADMDGSHKSAIVDMAGNGDISAQVYDTFGDNIVYNCMVGKSHWQGGSPPKISAGAPPTMFFAPDRAKMRFQDWGPDGFAKNLAAVSVPFFAGAQDWLDIDKAKGIEKFLPVYKAFLEGGVSPTKGYLFSL